jgi:hypothetical protein
VVGQAVAPLPSARDFFGTGVPITFFRNLVRGNFAK